MSKIKKTRAEMYDEITDAVASADLEDVIDNYKFILIEGCIGFKNLSDDELIETYCDACDVDSDDEIVIV